MITITTIFKALSDSTRRQILKMLSLRDMTAGEIAEGFSISKPSISHHLDVLRNANLVTTNRQGQFIIYSINTTIIQQAISCLIEYQSKK